MNINEDIRDLLFIQKKDLRKISEVYERNFYSSEYIEGYDQYYGVNNKIFECLPSLMELEKYLNENIILNESILEADVKSDKYKIRVLENLISNILQIDEYVYQYLNNFYNLKLTMLTNHKKQWKEQFKNFDESNFSENDHILLNNIKKITPNDIQSVNKMKVIAGINQKYILDKYTSDLIDLINSRSQYLRDIRNYNTHGQSMQFQSQIASLNLIQGMSEMKSINSTNRLTKRKLTGTTSSFLLHDEEIDIEELMSDIKTEIELTEKIINMLKTGIINNVELEKRNSEITRYICICQNCHAPNILINPLFPKTPIMDCMYCHGLGTLKLINYGYFNNLFSDFKDYLDRQLLIIFSDDYKGWRYRSHEIKMPIVSAVFEREYKKQRDKDI